MKLPGSTDLAADPVLDDLIRAWLNQLPKQTATYVRLGAILPVIDHPLLSALLDDARDADGAIQALRTLPFVTEDRTGQLTYTPSVREALLAEWWATSESQAAYRQANQRLLSRLESRVTQSDDPAARQRHALRWAYHALAANEQSGLALVDELFVRFKTLYQWDAAEQLLIRIAELRPILQESTRQWLDYFALDLAQTRNEPVEEWLQAAETLIHTNTNERLRALAHLSHGYARLSQLNWPDARADFASSLAYFSAQPDDLKLAEVLLAYAQFYDQLAQTMGDLSHARFDNEATQRQAWLRRFIDAPFSLFRIILRRWPQASSFYFEHGTHPGRLGLWLTTGYLGINYQDWLVARLLIQAIHWGQRAESESTRLHHTHALALAQEQLAVLYYKLGHHRHSDMTIRNLLATPWVRANPYRFAHAVRTQGNIAFIANQFQMAAQAFATTLPTFESVEDWEAVGQVSRLYGKVCLRLTDYAAAIENFARALTAFHQVDDDFGRTAVAVDLEYMVEQPKVAPGLRDQARQIFEQITVFTFAERFPGIIRKRFWQPNVLAGVAVWLVALLLIFLSALLFGGIEADIYLGTLGWNLFTLLGMMATPLLIIWSFQILYTLIGSTVYAWLIPLTALESAQPDIYIIDPDAFTYRQASSAQPTIKIRWATQPHTISEATYLAGRPIVLLSRLSLLSPNVRQIVPGAVRYFQRLQRAIAKQTAANHWHNYDIRLASIGWTLALLLLCFGLGFLFTLRSQFEIKSGLPGGIFTFGLCIKFTENTGQPPTQPIDCFTDTANVVKVPAALIFLVTSLVMLVIFPLEIGLRLAFRRMRASYTMQTIQRRGQAE